MGKQYLFSAKKEKADEFYTQLVDIEKELKHYREHFNNKIVYCNCDDPYESNFFKYFAMNFNYLKLKKLITVKYYNSPIADTELKTHVSKSQHGIKVEINEVKDYNHDGAINIDDVKWLLLNKKNTIQELKGDGDFRSEECINLLKQVDIVVTNPPFSLFREYIKQLFEYDKKFLILGNMNAITYKEVFPLIKSNKLWTGYGFNMSMIYKTVYENNLLANKRFVQSKGYDPKKNYIKVPAVNWFTNLNTVKRKEDLILFKKYNPKEYPKYDNYDAINVDKVSEIPYDYLGEIGVPITFLDKYNPDQFEIIKFRKGVDGKDLSINGKYPYFRIIIRRKKNEN